jgi:hypothetical protein
MEPGNAIGSIIFDNRRANAGAGFVQRDAKTLRKFPFNQVS